MKGAVVLLTPVKLNRLLELSIINIWDSPEVERETLPGGAGRNWGGVVLLNGSGSCDWFAFTAFAVPGKVIMGAKFDGHKLAFLFFAVAADSCFKTEKTE